MEFLTPPAMLVHRADHDRFIWVERRPRL